jgi:capsular exopolysaccharide synthesis family protein
MSKIFEALRKTEGGLAEVAKTVLADETNASSMTAPYRKLLDESVATPPEGPPTILSENNEREVRSERIELAPDSPMLPFDGSDDRAAEQYRIIRTKIQHSPSQPRIVLVSSAMPGDGKTITAINLAAALSLQEDSRVLLLDCDFRRCSATKLLGLNATPGLGEILRSNASLESSLIRVAQFPNLYVLPPGAALPGNGELLPTARWRSLLEILRSEFRFVVIDAPPIGAVAEYELLQMACDGVVLVVRQDHTDRQLWRRALETVPKAKQLGVILNCAEPWFLWKTNSYYYYGSENR